MILRFSLTLPFQNATFRAQLDFMNKRLSDANSTLERTRDDLETVEGRLERLRQAPESATLPHALVHSDEHRGPTQSGGSPLSRKPEGSEANPRSEVRLLAHFDIH
jgi:hypothetical protein